MKVERLQERIVYFVVLLGGLVFAIFCGKMAGGGQYNMLGKILAAMAAVATCLVLRARIWLLIPLFWPLMGAIPITEWPFAVRDYAVLIVFASFLILMGFKIVRTKAKFDAIDFFLLANVLYLCTVFVRNPVGVKAFDSELVGGKPYFNVFIACLAYFVLCRVPIERKLICRLPLFLLPAPAFVALGTLMNTYAPGLAGKLGIGLIYSEFAATEYQVNLAKDDMIGRKGGLSGIGVTGMQVLTSYFRPLTLFTPNHLGRLVLAITFTICVLLSGFRSSLLLIGVFIAFSSYFRKLGKDLLVFFTAGILGLSFLAVANGTLFELPLSVQRTLSFLPGNWDYAATADAKESIEWRVEMWSMVWHESKWITNKTLGDGFGFTRRELSLMESVAEGGTGFLGGAAQEAFMINGVFHNGPLSTIRYVGVVGLVFYYAFIVVLAMRALKIIRASQGTNLFAAALFVGVPVIFYALTFPLGSGQFDFDAPHHIFLAGLIKLVGRAVETLPKVAEEPTGDSFVGSSLPEVPAALPVSGAARLS